MEKDIVNIGKSVVIKGELNGSEDLTIEGHVEGTIQLREHVLTIGPNGRIKAQVFAKAVIVLGEVTGTSRPATKVDRDSSVDSDIIAPPLATPGAHFAASACTQAGGDKRGGQAGDTGHAAATRRRSQQPAGAQRVGA